MNGKVEKAILKGIETRGAQDLAEEIVDEIFSEEAQNKYFIDSIFDDKGQNATNDDKTAKEQESEKQDDSQANCGDENNKNQEQNFGKFKNPTELFKAYCELEKEFTRRSQKLKQLESEMANADVFASEEQWKEAVDKFFESTPSAKGFAKEIACKIMDEPELKKDKNCLSLALTKVLVEKFKTPQELMHDGQFLDEYVLSSKAVKDKIIDAYLKEVRNGQPPVMLVENGMQCVAPTIKPKSIQEAGMMFLKDNK